MKYTKISKVINGINYSKFVISIIIRIFNRAHVIPRAIKSVLGQSHRDFELIIVDDGLTDNTRERMRSIKDSRTEYFHQENNGVSAARNASFFN